MGSRITLPGTYPVSPGLRYRARPAIPYPSLTISSPRTGTNLQPAPRQCGTGNVGPLTTRAALHTCTLPTPAEQAWVTERLNKEGISSDTPIVVIHPGAGAAVKLWRTEAWSVCANALPGLLTSATPVRIMLTGSKGERPMLEEIASGMTSPPLLVTDATVGQLAALLQRAQLVLGVDSGPPHLAVAQGTPTIHIFGPTDPRIFGPWGIPRRHIVIASTQRCPTCPSIPCGRLDFRPEELVAHPCVRLVPEQQVEEAITTMLRKEKVALNPIAPLE